MAQISEILTLEKDRTDSSIHLFQEGSFFRAYEWSAWLCCWFISQFKVTHRKLKNIESSVVFVGFPVASLEKFTPAAACPSVKFFTALQPLFALMCFL